MLFTEDIKKHLTDKVGGRIFMTPTELEQYVIPISVRQQTRMRSEGRFPIAHHKAGKKVLYSIESIAKYVSEDKKEEKSKVVVSDLNKRVRVKINNKKKYDDDFDLSHVFSLKYILDELNEEVQRKIDLRDMLEKIIKINDLHEELSDELNN